jgi:hypothetical protein
VADARLNVGAAATLTAPTFTAAVNVTGSGSATFSGYVASGTGSGTPSVDARVRVGSGATLAAPAFTGSGGGGVTGSGAATFSAYTASGSGTSGASVPGAWPRTILPKRASPLVSPGPVAVVTHGGRPQRRATTQGGFRWTEEYPPFELVSVNGQQLLEALDNAHRNGRTVTIAHRLHLVHRGGGTGTVTVSGASQVGSALFTSGWGGTNPVLRAGDLVSIAGVQGARLITSDVTHTAGAATLPISPPILPGSSPANGAVVTYTGVVLSAYIATMPMLPDASEDGYLTGLTVSFIEAL